MSKHKGSSSRAPCASLALCIPIAALTVSDRKELRERTLCDEKSSAAVCTARSAATSWVGSEVTSLTDETARWSDEVGRFLAEAADLAEEEEIDTAELRRRAASSDEPACLSDEAAHLSDAETPPAIATLLGRPCLSDEVAEL